MPARLPGIVTKCDFVNRDGGTPRPSPLKKSRDRSLSGCTRRRFLVYSSGLSTLVPITSFAGETWVDRKPLEWSPQDVQTILNQSPWVKEVKLEMSLAEGDTGNVASLGGILTEFKVLVRWESGLPVRLARRESPSEPSEYVLSITRIPVAFVTTLSSSGARRPPEGAGNPDIGERIARSTALRTAGKKPIPATHVERLDVDFAPKYVIGFPRVPEPIELGDREVTFVSQIGPFAIKAKFALKPMVYRGKLEL
jgi:hypothetical protein